MLMLTRVLLALFRAYGAGGLARSNRRNDDLFVAATAASSNRARSEAQIGAVEVQANALPQHLNLVFGST